MRRAPLGLLVLAGCWTGAPVAPAAAPPPAPAAGTCTIRDADLEVTGVELALDGEVFATVNGELLALELRVRKTRAAQARVENDAWVLEGEVDLARSPLRPRRHVHDGWVEVVQAHARRVRGGAMRLEVTLPDGVVPHSLTIERPCARLTAAPAPPADVPDDAEVMQLVPGAHALRRTPGGRLLAKLVSRPGKELVVLVLERRRGAARVRISAVNAVTGWVDDANLVPQTLNGLLGGFGYGRRGIAPPMLRCPRPLAVFVRSPARGVVRVGTIKAKAGIQPRTLLGPANPEITIDLGDATLRPFVRATDLGDCS